MTIAKTCARSVRLGERTTVELTGDERTAISAVELLDASDEWIEERCGWWYIAERDLRWLRRNALIVMGNGAATDDQQATDLLVRYATADDEVLAEHARWALARVDSRRAAQVML